MKADRFKKSEFTNRSGTKSWRVSGTKRDGTRIRENFGDEQAAQCRKTELEGEYLSGQTETLLRSTTLTDVQVRTAEAAFARLGTDGADDLLSAVEYWVKHGKQNAVAESPRIDDAFIDFKKWLDGPCQAKGGTLMRDHSKRNLRIRVNTFANSIPNMRVSDVRPETVEEYLAKRNTSAKSQDNDRRAISRFFSWCGDRKRRWTIANPARMAEIEAGETERGDVAIFTVDQCKKLLKAACQHEKGALVPYVAVCLFGGLRPFEASRLTWDQVNLKDGEIRLTAQQTKTKRPRTVTICKTLKAWLNAFPDRAFFPTNWRKEFDAVKKSAGITTWPVDVMRHTAISHYFRKTGSYGETAEQFGNSEAIIKAHYQSRVSTEDTKEFYALLPGKVKR